MFFFGASTVILAMMMMGNLKFCWFWLHIIIIYLFIFWGFHSQDLVVLSAVMMKEV